MSKWVEDNSGVIVYLVLLVAGVDWWKAVLAASGIVLCAAIIVGAVRGVAQAFADDDS